MYRVAPPLVLFAAAATLIAAAKRYFKMALPRERRASKKHANKACTVGKLWASDLAVEKGDKLGTVIVDCSR